MDKTEELREKIRKRNDLLPKLIEMWKNNASSEDTLKVIKDAGFDVTIEDVENLLALVQKKRAEGISFEMIDYDELTKISGGWCFLWQTEQGMYDSCSDSFKNPRYCDRTGIYVCTSQHKDICLALEYCDSVVSSIVEG